MEKIVPALQSADYSKRTSKRSCALLDKVNEIVEEQSHSSKQPKAEDDSSTEDREYEEWKQRIIESATKALCEEKKAKEKTNS